MSMYSRLRLKLVSALLVMAMIVPAIPAFADPEVDNLTMMMYSKAAQGTPTIDGIKDAAYNDTAALTPRRWKQGKVSDVSGQFHVLWDSGSLYVYAEVQDAVLNTASANTWDRDSIEVFIEEDNNRKDTYGNGDHQIRIMADGGSVWIKSTELTGSDVTTFYQSTATGYIIEAKIDVISSLSANRHIGFDLQINDADASGNRVGLIGWNDYRDNAGKFPKDMGQLQLVTGPTTTGDTVLMDYPPLAPPIPEVDFSSTTVLEDGQVRLLGYESTAPLLNPGKGWVLYGNVQSGGKPDLQTEETLALGTVGYTRYNWYEIEPTEGNYNWAMIDDAIAAWDAVGKTFAFGVINANTARPHINYITPQWVEAAGAQFVEVDITFNLDAELTGTQMVPVWNDPIFIEKLDQFLEALADRYDNDPRVEFIDVRSYGNFGESAVWGLSESPNPARRSVALSDEDYQELHIDTYKQHFQNKLLIVAKGTNAHEQLYRSVPDQGIGLRFDGVITGYPYYLAEASTKVPTVYEFVAGYEQMKRENQWTDYAFYKSITQGNPSYIGMGQYYSDAKIFLSEQREVIEAGANLMGYHFVLNDIVLPETIAAGEDADIILNWANKGFAPIYKGTHIALALMDSSNTIVHRYWLDELDPQEWLPRTVTESAASLTLNAVSDGTYKLAIGMFANKSEANPTYRIGNRNQLTNGWYIVSYDVAVADNEYTFASLAEAPISVEINSFMQAYDQQPYIDDSKVMVPLQPTFAALGAEVTINGSQITVEPADGDVFVLTIGQGGVSSSAGAAFIEGGKVADYFPVDVTWMPETSTLKIVNQIIETEFMASHEWMDSSNVLREARLAFDGRPETSWVANYDHRAVSAQSPVWIQRNFAEPVTFDTVNITEHPGATAGEIGQFNMHYWDEGTWHDAYVGEKATAGVKGSVSSVRFEPVTTMKFRLLITSATVGYVNVREIELLNSEEPEFMASHEWTDGANVLREASLAFDGNPGTSWVANVSAHAVTENAPVWIQRNYEEPTTINTVRITESAAPSAGEIGNFKLQYWSGGAWLDAYAGTMAGTGDKGDTYTVEFEPVTTYKFRLLVTSATVGYVNVREIEALNWEQEFMASDAYNQYTADLAFDGDLNTRWIINRGTGAVSASAPVWIQRNYASPLTFNTVTITESEISSYGDLGAFKLQYWSGGAWQDAYTGNKVSTGARGDSYTYTFAPVTSAKFRLLVTSASGSGWMAVKEIEVYEAVEAAATLTGSEEALAGRAFELTAGIEHLDEAVVILNMVVNYDPQQLEFAYTGEAGAEALAATAFESLLPGLELVDSAVIPESGRINLILWSVDGSPIQVDGAVFRLKGQAKAGIAAGESTVFLSDAVVISSEVDEILLSTTGAFHALMVGAQDTTELAAAIAAALSVHNTATEGMNPGQYPSGSKANLWAAIQAAIGVRDDATAIQDEIDQAAVDVTEAVASFQASVLTELPGNPAALHAAIAAAQGLYSRTHEGTKLGQYEAGARTQLHAAIVAAGNAGASQAAIDLALASLETAIEQFRARIITLIPGATKVSLRDLATVARFYGAAFGDDEWDEIGRADVQNVNVIDIRNLAAIARMILDDWRLEA